MTKKNILVDGIIGRIETSLDKTIEKNEREMFSSIYNFCFDVLMESYAAENVNIFAGYCRLTESIYEKYKHHCKYNKGLLAYEEYYCERASVQLTTLMSHVLLLIEFDKQTHKNRDNNKFLYHLFFFYNIMIYKSITKDDFSAYSIFIKNLSKLSFPTDYNLQQELMRLEFETVKNEDAIKTINDKLAKLNTPVKYFRHVKLGIIYWLYYLFRIGNLTEQKLISYLDKTRSPMVTAEDCISDVLFFYSREVSFGYLGWSSFAQVLVEDENEENNGFIASTHEWLSFGFVIDCLREDKMILPVQHSGIFKNNSSIEIVADETQKICNEILLNFQKWQPIFGRISQEKLNERISNFTSAFFNLKRLKISEEESRIAEAALSSNKIEIFTQNIGKVYESNSLANFLFSYFQNRKTTIEQTLNPIGFKRMLGGGKRMFLENFHEPAFNSGFWGGDIARRENNYLLSTLLHISIPSFGIKDPIEGILQGISTVKEKGYSPSVIFISNDYAFTEKIISDVDFKQRWKEKNSFEFQYYIGTFKGIPVYSLRESYLNGKLVVCDFKSAISQLQNTNKSWFNTSLKVNVYDISVEEANIIYKENPSQWSKDSDGKELKIEDSINWIRNSVYCDISLDEKIDLLNKDAVFIGKAFNAVTTVNRPIID